MAAIAFASGAVGTFTATTAAFDGLPVGIDIFGTEGSAIIEGDCLKSLTLKTGKNTADQTPAAHAVSVAKGGTASVKDEAERQTRRPARRGLGRCPPRRLEDFIRAIRANARPLIDGQAGRMPVEFIMAVYESARTGKAVKLG